MSEYEMMIELLTSARVPFEEEPDTPDDGGDAVRVTVQNWAAEGFQEEGYPMFYTVWHFLNGALVGVSNWE